MMKIAMKLSAWCVCMAISLIFTSCNDDGVDQPYQPTGEGTLLNVYVGFEAMTKGLAELPGNNLNVINDDGSTDLNHLGLYIYYKSDYDRGYLEEPYVRNMECKVEDGKLVPVTQPGENPNNEDIYIYDDMTLVLFYPYNIEMSMPANYFKVKEDEENYPITRLDYSQQNYIPYRGQVNVNPTTAFYIQIPMYPKHTFKIEIVLVSDDGGAFGNKADGKVLPDMDPVDNTNPNTGKRQRWYDFLQDLPDTGGGSDVLRYVAYLWTTDDLNPVIERNDVLFENGEFTLLASERVDLNEQRVYRYGYNFSTGEIFIPTSSNLIHDDASLRKFSATNSTAYQVCDIDASVGGNWTPLSMVNSVYDGGGHAITGLNLNTTGNEAGLFGAILGNSRLKNVNLIEPQITVNAATDTCYVGALCGRVNNELTDEQIQALYGSALFPDNLAEVVKEALLKELLQDVLDSKAQIIGCRVAYPSITVTGTHPRVGTICGSNGEQVNNGNYRGVIWDTYSLGGEISVNAGNPAANEGAAVGGFCGLNEYLITRSYATISADSITAQGNQADNSTSPPSIIQVDIWQGFANQGDQFSGETTGITSSFAEAPDTNPGVSQFSQAWPSGWVQYAGIWPINTSGWNEYTANSYWYELGARNVAYPTLQWERR